MSSLPALSPNPDTRSLTERLNVLIRERNEARNPVAVASLPDATKNTGSARMVNDATATTFWTIVAGGGANTVPVRSDGTNWRIA